MRIKIALAAAGVAGLMGTATAQDAYVIGVTSALTGPPASTYAPAMDALRIYIDGVNARGGINGKKINLVIQDDSAEPSKAVANVKKLVSQDNAILLINASLSSTYAPVVAESRNAKIPLMFASGVCPKEVYPPANELQFCTTAYASQFDSRAALTFVKETAKQPVKIGFSAMAIPLSRGEMEFAAKLAPEMGMTALGIQVVPPPTPDYTPFATNLKDAGANWVFSWAPWVTQVRTLEALRRLGWEGDYITWAHLEAEGELKRLRDGKLFVIGANALFEDNLPIQKEIAEAAKKAGSKYPPDQMTEGWIAGMVIEAALRGAKQPVTAETLRESMSNLKVDTKGLRGGPIEWTKDNHFRTKQFYRVYKWDPATNKIVVAKDWFSYDVK
ncbi:ABC transporter substrate-binding protein [Pseudorhodoplanes sp.]|uniref:ABC transporter substrate-binding protein n=1 Tax=Pseudorhodoplanes sp. TaxID=1934341 RepID=UPI00391A3FD6